MISQNKSLKKQWRMHGKTTQCLYLFWSLQWTTKLLGWPLLLQQIKTYIHKTKPKIYKKKQIISSYCNHSTHTVLIQVSKELALEIYGLSWWPEKQTQRELVVLPIWYKECYPKPESSKVTQMAAEEVIWHQETKQVAQRLLKTN